jgi:hypothetical protein
VIAFLLIVAGLGLLTLACFGVWYAPPLVVLGVLLFAAGFVLAADR